MHLPHAPKWGRLPEESSRFEFSYSDPEEGGDGLTLRWRHTFQWDEGRSFFAFCYPFSYDECLRCVKRLERVFHGGADEEEEEIALGPATNPRGLYTFPLPVQQSEWAPRAGTGIYFHRQELTRSLQGRIVEILTVTADDGECCSSSLEESPDSLPPSLGDPARHFQGR